MSERKVLDREAFRVLLEWAAAACLAVVLGLLPTTAAAQVLYGSMTGTVTDSSGAAIPGATVTIKDEQTGLALSAVTRLNRNLYHPQHHRRHLHDACVAAGLQGIRPDRHSTYCRQRRPYQWQAGDRR